MAKKKAEAPLQKIKLPVDPKILGGVLVIVIIIVALAMSNGGEKAAAPVDTGGEEAPYAPPAPAAEDEPAVTPTAQCTQNSDCDDNNDCTTDSCTAGKCANTVAPSCVQKVEEAPRITAANFGNVEDEFVQLKGKNIDLAGWKITNAKGDVYWQLDRSGYKIINGVFTVYSRCALDTTIAVYKCLDSGFFADSGDKAILYNDKGEVASEFSP